MNWGGVLGCISQKSARAGETGETGEIECCARGMNFTLPELRRMSEGRPLHQRCSYPLPVAFWRCAAMDLLLGGRVVVLDDGRGQQSSDDRCVSLCLRGSGLLIEFTVHISVKSA